MLSLINVIRVTNDRETDIRALLHHSFTSELAEITEKGFAHRMKVVNFAKKITENAAKTTNK